MAHEERNRRRSSLRMELEGMIMELDYLEDLLDLAVEEGKLTDHEAWLEYNLAVYEGCDTGFYLGQI